MSSIFTLILIIITATTFTILTSAAVASSSATSLIAEPLSNRTFRLTAEQCPHLAEIFTASGLTGATYLDSCSARFLHLDRLYDDALLLGVALDSWNHGANRRVVNLATLAQQISGRGPGMNAGVFDYLNAALVVRLDGCRSQSGSATVRISPPPARLSENGLASVVLTPSGVGELLVTSVQFQQSSRNGFRPDIYEVTMAGNDHQQQQCSLANTRLLICGRPADPDQQQQQQKSPNCHVHLFDADQRLVECRCDSTGFFRGQYLCAVVVVMYLLILIVGSLTIKSRNNSSQTTTEEEEQDELDQEEDADQLIKQQQQPKQQQNFAGLTEEHVMGNVASRAHAYHYQVIYRVACPTVHFDPRATISFQLLGGADCLQPLYSAVGFAMAASEDDPSGGLMWNVFTTDVFLPRPLPKVKAVRTSHDGHPQTGLYLFDVQVLFVRRPKLVEIMEEDERDVDSKSLSSKARELLEDKKLSTRPQRLPIYAYILDHPNVYRRRSRGKKGAPIELPPTVSGTSATDLPLPSLSYLKVLAWLATAEALLLSALLLDHLYLRFNMLLASLLASFTIAAVILLQLLFTIWLHGRLVAESLHHQLLYECLADNWGEENIEGCEDEEEGGKQKRAKKKQKKKKKANKNSKSSPRNCGYLFDTLLLLLLLGVIAACLGTLLLYDHRLLLEQPPLKAFYFEVITLLSLTLVGGSLWLILGQGGELICCSSRLQSRVATEERLMAESNLRGGQLSVMTNSGSSKTTAVTTTTKTKTTEKRKKRSGGRRRNSPSPSSSDTSSRSRSVSIPREGPTILGTPKGTFKMISSSDNNG